ncbi:MAG: FAD-dependent oxidoreductase [Betaproteobacteria bacterium]
MIDSLPNEVDFLIVGGGLAGYCAALEASNFGATVLLIEKQDKIGGATVLSGGSFAFAGTPLQIKLGINDSNELLFQDLLRVGAYENDQTLVRLYVDRQMETFNWFEKLGVTFANVFLASGQSVPRGHSLNAQKVLDIVAMHANSTGRVRTLLNTSARRLITSETNGAVIGALIEHEGKLQKVFSKKGVLLATGGFSRNEALLNLFAPGQVGAQRMGSPGNTGEGLLMAWQIGAAFCDVAHIKGTFGNHPSAGPEDHFLLFPMYAGGIIVNSGAKRFVDESLSYKLLGEACLKQPDHIGYQIFDQSIFKKGQPGIPSMDFNADLRAGRVVKALTLKGIADLLGLDSAKLERTVLEYNEFVAKGHDEAFGRDGLCNHYGSLVKIETGPFYAYASRSVVLATYCGLTVDMNMRVKDVYGAVIPKLFAAGGVIGGFHGQGYMTGTANGKASIFGRIAAQVAVLE